MAFQTVPETCSFVIEYGATSLKWTNTIYVQRSSWSEAGQLLVANTIMGNFADDIMAELAQDWDCYKVTSYDLRSEGGPVVVSTADAVDGVQTDSPLAVNCAMVVTIRTNTRGRSGRGRNYVAGFTEVQGGSAAFGSQALAEAIEDAYTGLHNELDTLGYNWVVVQRYSNKVKLAVALTHDVTQFEVRNLKYGSQRRRIQRT